MLISQSTLAKEEAASARDRRGAGRHLITQRCIISSPGANGPGGWHCIAYNISATGVGVLLPMPIRAETILQIEPWQLPGAPVLQARVIHTKPFEFVWMAGCELCTPLCPDELRAWLGKRARK